MKLKPNQTVLVMLKRTWPGNFRRSVHEQIPAKDKDGKPTGKTIHDKFIETLTFTPGNPEEVNAAQHAAIESDIGRALDYIVLDEKGRPRIVAKLADAIAKPVESAAKE